MSWYAIYNRYGVYDIGTITFLFLFQTLKKKEEKKNQKSFDLFIIHVSLTLLLQLIEKVERLKAWNSIDERQNKNKNKSTSSQKRKRRRERHHFIHHSSFNRLWNIQFFLFFCSSSFLFDRVGFSRERETLFNSTTTEFLFFILFYFRIF